MPRKEYKTETRSTRGSGDSVMESRLGVEGSGKSTAVNRGEELVIYSPGPKSVLAYFCKSSFIITQTCVFVCCCLWLLFPQGRAESSEIMWCAKSQMSSTQPLQDSLNILTVTQSFFANPFGDTSVERLGFPDGPKWHFFSSYISGFCCSSVHIILALSR